MPDDNFTIDMLIQKILTTDKQYDLSKIITAYEFAAKAHEGQTRSSGQPYIIHPLAVAFILLDLGMDTDTICAAILHDVVEDTDITIEELIIEGFPKEVIDAIELMTHSDSVPYLDYVKIIKNNPIARKVKLADLMHNSDLSRLDKIDDKVLERVAKYKKAIGILQES